MKNFRLIMFQVKIHKVLSENILQTYQFVLVSSSKNSDIKLEAY